MKKVLISMILIFLSLLSVSCTNSSNPLDGVDTGDVIINNVENGDYEIPNIVFIEYYFYGDKIEFDYENCRCTIYDINGQVLKTENKQIYQLSFEELLDKYNNGELENKLVKVKYYSDKEGFNQCINNYQNILQNKNFELESEEINLCIVSEYHIEWYGLYYDEDNTLHSKCLLVDENGGGSSYPNDKRVNQIRQWLRENGQ